jgi:hypothetical protein
VAAEVLVAPVPIAEVEGGVAVEEEDDDCMGTDNFAGKDGTDVDWPVYITVAGASVFLWAARTFIFDIAAAGRALRGFDDSKSSSFFPYIRTKCSFKADPFISFPKSEEER